MLKDYYKILELEPNADEIAIKRQFRKLAMRFHPDVNQELLHADAWYREIQEAYQVLNDPIAKAQYHEQRWLLKSQGKPFTEIFPLSPDYIAQRVALFATQVRQMDHFRMDHKALQKQILELVNDEVLGALSHYQEISFNKKILADLLRCMEPLKYKETGVLKPTLIRLSEQDAGMLRGIEVWYGQRKREAWWTKHQGWIIAGITLLLCGLIIVLTN
jgi:curved DNA-binding protein CbpA